MLEPPNSEPHLTDPPKKKSVGAEWWRTFELRLRRDVWWPKLKIILKGIVKLAELGAAVVVVVAWFPMAVNALRPELREYETLKSLYAGASVSFFDSKLGTPAIIRALPTEKGTTERLYVKDDYIVQTLANAEGETRLYSVLSCRPDFKPRLGGRITLQEKPLAAQWAPGQEPKELYYLQPAAVLNTVYFEFAAYASGFSRNRDYGAGVNGACSKALPAREYVGPPSEAPEAIRNFRDTAELLRRGMGTTFTASRGRPNLLQPRRGDPD